MRSKRNSHQHRTVSFADRHTGVSAVLVLASGERRDHVQSTATCFLQVVQSDTLVIADARTIDVVVEVILRHLPNPLWSSELIQAVLFVCSVQEADAAGTGAAFRTLWCSARAARMMVSLSVARRTLLPGAQHPHCRTLFIPSIVAIDDRVAVVLTDVWRVHENLLPGGLQQSR